MYFAFFIETWDDTHANAHQPVAWLIVNVNPNGFDCADPVDVALRSFFMTPVSGLYDPKSSVIAEVLAQEFFLHNFNQFWLITVDSVDLHFYK